ncbi:MAG: inositol monophosphatase [Candidatus Micrarchaeota archaeon]|nr:inositol monophosphatase [Candidatus Micrarchaeota archaeon]
MSSFQEFIASCLLGAAARIEKERASLSIKRKGRRDMATSADLASEKFIAAKISKEFPGAKIFSEESFFEKELEAESLFVIDPIDGTHNFIWGIPLYGVSVAHYSFGKPLAGGIYLIPQKMLLYAEKGKQATLNGKKISVSKTSRLEDFFLLCDSRLHIIKEQGWLDKLAFLEEISQHTRFLGSTIYEIGYVACGVADAQISFKLKPYDFAAAAFIAQQAGAKVTDLEGKPWSLESRTLLSSNGKQHARILEIFQS